MKQLIILIISITAIGCSKEKDPTFKEMSVACNNYQKTIKHIIDDTKYKIEKYTVKLEVATNPNEKQKLQEALDCELKIDKLINSTKEIRKNLDSVTDSLCQLLAKGAKLENEFKIVQSAKWLIENDDTSQRKEINTANKILEMADKIKKDKKLNKEDVEFIRGIK